MSIIGKGHIDINIEIDKISEIVGAMHEFGFEDIMVYEFGIDFEIWDDTHLVYEPLDKFKDWLLEHKYKFKINVEEWRLDTSSGYYYDTEEGAD